MRGRTHVRECECKCEYEFYCQAVSCVFAYVSAKGGGGSGGEKWTRRRQEAWDRRAEESGGQMESE
eukprot:4590299-Pleurochrysis_carterae.AAC.3